MAIAAEAWLERVRDAILSIGLQGLMDEINDALRVSVVSGVSAIRAYSGAQRITLAGAAQAATLPAGTNIVVLAAEGGDVRYAIDAIATSTTAGYLPAGSILTIVADGIASLSVYGATGAFANMVYYEG